MKSYDRNFYELLTQVGQTYVIPSFQRDYAWDIPQWQALWDDIEYLIKNPSKYHYTGALVYIPSQEHTTYLREVIDGQQRLTTMSLIYLAAHTLLKEGILTDYNPDSLWVQVLANQYGVENERLKLKPSGTDFIVYKKIFDGNTEGLTSVEKKSNIFRGYKYYLDKLTVYNAKIDDLIGAAQRLQVIEIVLNQNDDHPQKVFESINSTGKKLTIDDLIRNYVLMRGNHREREKIFKEYWSPIEAKLKNDNDSLLEDFFTTFIKLYLKKDVTRSSLYESFKQIYDGEEETEHFLGEILVFASIYEYMKYDRGIYAESLSFLRYYFDVLNFLKIDIFNTFTLPVIKDFLEGSASREDTEQVFSFIVNYLTRRILSGRSTTSLNKYAPGLYPKINKYKIDSISDALIYEFTASAPAQLTYPSDQDVELGIRNRDFYSSKDNCRYILLALDNSNLDIRHKKLLKDGSLTIEHVMPQTLSRTWKNQLGPYHADVYEKYINNLANLTLTAYNSLYSNRPYAEKLNTPERTGLAESPLLVNQFFKSTNVWDADALKKRQDHLVKELLGIFPALRPQNDYAAMLSKEFIPLVELGDPTGKVPAVLMLFDATYPTSTWKELYLEFVNALIDVDGADDVISAIKIATTGSPLISKDESELRGPGLLKCGYYLECHKSSADIASTIIRIVDALNDVDLDDIKIKLK